MSTRGTIALELEDGSIQVIYSHFDNYITGTGKILQEHYTDRTKIEKLISYGNISSLGEQISDEPQSFNDCPKKYTNFYMYRGDEVVDVIWGSFDDYEMNQPFEEFNYLFTKDGVWSVYISDKDEWFDLEVLLQ